LENKLTIRQAAKLTGYLEAHLRRLAKRGEAFEAEMFGYNWAIDKDSLLAFVQRQKREGGRYGPRRLQG